MEVVGLDILLNYPQIIEDKIDKMIVTGSTIKRIEEMTQSSNPDIENKAKRAKSYLAKNLDNIKIWESCNYESKDKTVIEVDTIAAADYCNLPILTNNLFLTILAKQNDIEVRDYRYTTKNSDIYYHYIELDENLYSADLEELLQNRTIPNGIELLDGQYLLVKDINNKDSDEYLCLFYYEDGKLEDLDKITIKNSYIETIRPRNVEQECLFNSLSNKKKTIVYAGGRFGTGKSFLINNYALQELEKGTIKKIVYIPNNSYVENSMELGYLPGSDLDKSIPSIGPLIDLIGIDFVNKLISKEELEIVPLAYIRGRSFLDTIVIVNEAQNLTEDHIKLLIGRCGKGTRIFFDGDIKQADRQIFRDKNGLNLLFKLKESPIYSKLFSAIQLYRTERSLTACAADFLDNY